MKSMKKKMSMRTIRKKIEACETQFFTMVVSIPNKSLTQIIDQLEVSDNTFGIDLVLHTVGLNGGHTYNDDDLPYINTLHEIPSHLLKEGASITEEMKRMQRVILDWMGNTDLNELKTALRSTVADFLQYEMMLEPVEVRINDNYMIIEFEVFSE